MKKIEVVFSNGKEFISYFYNVKDNDKDNLIYCLGKECKKNWYIDEVFYL